MIGLPSTVKIFLITEPTDMRKGFYTLADIVKRLGHNPLLGHLFVFLSKKSDRCKILFWSDGGFILWYKKLERGKFKKPKVATQETEIFISPSQLTLILEGVDFTKIKKSKRWNPQNT